MNDRSVQISAAILGGAVSVGLLGAGYFVSNTLYKGKLASNTVTVRGFAERDVRADLALWRIGVSDTGGDLPQVYSRTRADVAKVNAYLSRKGFRPQAVLGGDLEVTDLMANQYNAAKVDPDKRYLVKDTITVRSSDVDRVSGAVSGLNDLISQGVVLTANSVDFEYTHLNDIKAPMLKAATENARAAAQQFANDAGSKVGSIQNASQGFFSIVSREAAGGGGTDNENGNGQGNDQPNTADKRARVVVTLTYYLIR